MARTRSVMATDRTALCVRIFMCNVSTSRSQEGTNKCKVLHADVPIYQVSMELTA